jgi:hypothetical protein
VSSSFRASLADADDVGVPDFVVHRPRPSAPHAGDLTTVERIVSRAS